MVVEMIGKRKIGAGGTTLSNQTAAKKKLALGDTGTKQMGFDERLDAPIPELGVVERNAFRKKDEVAGDPDVAEAVAGYRPDVEPAEVPKRGRGRPKKVETEQPKTKKEEKAEKLRAGMFEKAAVAHEAAERVQLTSFQLKELRKKMTSRVKRPSDMSEDQYEALYRSVAGGATLGAAASAALVNRHLAEEWYAQGSIPGCDDEELSTFASYMNHAKGEAERLAIGIVKSAALNGAWQAAGWFLERSDPLRYSVAADRMKYELRGAVRGLRSDVDLGTLTTEQLLRLAGGDFSEFEEVGTKLDDKAKKELEDGKGHAAE